MIVAAKQYSLIPEATKMRIQRLILTIAETGIEFIYAKTAIRKWQKNTSEKKMTKSALESENRRLKEEIQSLRKKIAQLGDLNKQAFKRQHDAEGRLNQLYAEIAERTEFGD